MLDELERKVTAVVADGLVARPDLAVRQAPGDSDAAIAGAGTLRVGIIEWSPASAGFEREQFVVAEAGSRRVLPLNFVVRLAFFRRPAGDAAAQRAAARALLLDDMALASHHLAAATVRDGSALRAAAADPGYAVQSFNLVHGDTENELRDGLLTGRLDYAGHAQIWPPGPPQAEGRIRRLEVVGEALPLSLSAQPPQVAAGGTARIGIRGAAPGRRLSLSVRSDLPPAQRGTLAGGQAGVESGTRLLAVAEPETVVEYRAPAAADLGATRQEVVDIHLATPDGRRGMFLGAIALGIVT